MELSTLSIFIILLVLMFVVNVILQREMTKQEEYQDRQDLQGEVKQFRLYKMLEFLGIDKEKYIEKLPKEAIKQHIKRCSDCGNVDICDDHLLDGKRVTNMNFCPNYKSLIRYSGSNLSEEVQNKQ